jgi:pimeloyl-ACP methyl ester carboxylesterase
MALPVIAVRPEGPRYGAPLLFLPGLWATPDVWRRAAGLLAHRGWEGWIVDPSGVGGATARAAAVAAVTGDLGRPPVIVASDGAGLVAAELARRMPVAGVVWIAPVLPGGVVVRRAISPWRVLAGLLLARRIERPAAWLAEAEAAVWRRDADDAAVVIDMVRGRIALGPLGVPTLLAAGDQDPRSGARERAALATALGADVFVLPEAGSVPLAVGAWQSHTGAVHRWLVQRLGDGVLELYAEAMAERDEE